MLLLVGTGVLLAACDNTPPAPSATATASAPAAAPAASASPAAEFGAPGVAPRFEVDPLWPKPLPNHWLLGSTIGVSVDSRDHVWIIHRQQSLNAETEASAGRNAPTGECCMPAPNVIELDAQGNVASSWGGPGQGYDWPTSNHGITVDHMDNVWIGGNDPKDAHVLKFSRSGQFLLQLGKPEQNKGSNDPVNFWRVAKISIDAEANEAYIADGYGNKRVVVIDADPQGSALDWSEQRAKEDLPRLFGVLGLARDTLHREAPEIARDADHVLIDGPPRVATLMRSALLAADLIVIPAQPSPFDGWASGEILRLLQEARAFRPQLVARFVLNRCGARTVIARETAEALANHEPPVLAGQTIAMNTNSTLIASINVYNSSLLGIPDGSVKKVRITEGFSSEEGFPEDFGLTDFDGGVFQG